MPGLVRCGHQLFTGMRAAASDGADLALVLVAADAGIQPQTREVVRRCARLGQPVLFALTKADTAGSCRSVMVFLLTARPLVGGLSGGAGVEAAAPSAPYSARGHCASPASRAMRTSLRRASRPLACPW